MRTKSEQTVETHQGLYLNCRRIAGEGKRMPSSLRVNFQTGKTYFHTYEFKCYHKSLRDNISKNNGKNKTSKDKKKREEKRTKVIKKTEANLRKSRIYFEIMYFPALSLLEMTTNAQPT